MNNFLDVYRKKINKNCLNKQQNNLINKAVGTTTIKILRTKNIHKVNLNIDNKKEGYGTSIFYCSSKDDIAIGDYFEWKKQIFLITKEEKNVYTDDNIHKFYARECNIIFNYFPNKNSGKTIRHYGVLIGSADKKVGETLDKRNTIPVTTNNDDFVLIYSGVSLRNYEKIIINNKQWNVLSTDDDTAIPINYSTIHIVPNTEQFKGKVPTFPEKYYAGVEYTFHTEDFYFQSNDISPIERTENQVVIKMPYKKIITFEVKENGFFVDKTINIEQ